jgi:leucyl aminopeptidase (aminopeptidase T)
MKIPAPDAALSSTPARKRTKTRPAARRRTDENTYSNPELREQLRAEIRAAAKGGEPGTWSARKSQLLTLAYQKSGGGYLQQHPNSKPRNVQGAQADKAARRPATAAGYLSASASDDLTPAQRKAATARKLAGAKAGKHTVASTPAAKPARKHAE